MDMNHDFPSWEEIEAVEQNRVDKDIALPEDEDGDLDGQNLGGFAKIALEKWTKKDQLGVLHMLITGELYERLHKIDELAETELPRLREKVMQALPNSKPENESIHAVAVNTIATQQFLDLYTEMPQWEGLST